MNTSTETGEIFTALAKANLELDNASKNSTNPHFKSKYADLAEVINTVRPVYAKHGMAVIQSTGYRDGVVYVVTRICHESGQWVESESAAPASKLDPQGVGSATTYLRRYSLAAMAFVAQEDDDGQSSSGAKTITPEQVANFRMRLDSTESDISKFLSALKVATLEQIPANQYDRAESLIAKKEEAYAKQYQADAIAAAGDANA